MLRKVLVTLGVVALLVVVGAASFYYGTQYGKEQAQNARAEFLRDRGFQQGAHDMSSGDAMQANPGQRGAQGRVVATGTVKSVNGSRIEVTTPNGSVTVTVESSTQILKSVAIAVGDIEPGQRIMVTSDQTGNNVTARIIQLQSE